MNLLREYCSNYSELKATHRKERIVIPTRIKKYTGLNNPDNCSKITANPSVTKELANKLTSNLILLENLCCITKLDIKTIKKKANKIIGTVNP